MKDRLRLPRPPSLASLPPRLVRLLRGLFLQEQPPGGGNAGGGNSNPNNPNPPDEPSPPPRRQPPRRPDQGPPDLDELWRDFNRKLGQLFGGKGGGRDGGKGNDNGGHGLPNLPRPDMRNVSAGLVAVAVVVALIWLGSGIFTVKEGQQAVITQFGKYRATIARAGLNWRLPWPIQRHEIVNVTQIRSLDVGGTGIVPGTGLPESAMLTSDENIVEIKFSVQYRLSDARAYLFNTQNPQDAVEQAAKSAVREVVGQMTMDRAMADERDQIGPRVRKLMQAILDRYQSGVEVVAVNLQQSGVSPPEQVKAAFDDVLRAGQERQRAQNEAQAYANSVVPRASGAAARLKQEAEGYKASVVAQAQGDTQRFSAVLAQYEKAPQVTRQRLYIDTMREIYSRATKVLVDGRAAGNLIYLPLDKVLQAAGAKAPGSSAAAQSPSGQSGQAASGASGGAQSTGSASAGNIVSDNNGAAGDPRSRDNARSRDREGR